MHDIHAASTLHDSNEQQTGQNQSALKIEVLLQDIIAEFKLSVDETLRISTVGKTQILNVFLFQ